MEEFSITPQTTASKMTIQLNQQCSVSMLLGSQVYNNTGAALELLENTAGVR